MTDEQIIEINSKKEYDDVQNDLLAKGYKWIDGCDEYYDLFEYANGFYKMVIVVHHQNETFEWRFR